MIKARLFDTQSSDFEEVNIEFKDQEFYLHRDDETYHCPINKIRFSDRLGHMPRSLYLPDGRVCESEDNDTIDALLKEQNSHKGNRLIHTLESRSLFILPALLVTASIVFIFLKYLLPYGSEKIAYAIPQSIASKIGTGTLETLDKVILKPSKLSQAKQNEIRDDFNAMARHLQALPPLQLQFRFADKVGANAFALPDGTIVMTDQLVLLSENNLELLSILAHEIGHIKNRHAIRMVLQNSALLVVLTTLTGDATTASSVISTLPTMLIESSFSRNLESEADDFAMEVMKEQKIPLHHFADIMSRLSMGEDEESSGEYFSSHPITSSRIEKFSE